MNTVGCDINQIWSFLSCKLDTGSSQHDSQIPDFGLYNPHWPPRCSLDTPGQNHACLRAFALDVPRCQLHRDSQISPLQGPPHHFINTICAPRTPRLLHPMTFSSVHGALHLPTDHTLYLSCFLVCIGYLCSIHYHI